MEMLCLLKDQAVGYRSGLTYGTNSLELLHWLVSAARVHRMFFSVSECILV